MNREDYKKYYQIPCPKCGQPMYYRSKTCFDCRQKKDDKPITRSTHHHKEPCPICGRPKLIGSGVCASCKWKRDYQTLGGRIVNKKSNDRVDLSGVPESFLYQLTGLFYGEGCIHAAINTYNSISINISIKLRADDAATLELIQSTIGGSFHIYTRKTGIHSPEVIWSVTKFDDIEILLMMFKAHTLIPMRKETEIDVALDYITWRKSQPFHNVDRNVVEMYYQKLHDLKQLKS